MKGLVQFLEFDWNRFSRGKRYICTAVSEYADYESKTHLGTKVEAVIAEDKTPYQFRDGKTFTNRFERITFKLNKDIDIPVDVEIIPHGVKATVYGDYRNQLSVKCDDIEVVTATKGKD